jgi:translation initiation factor IF-1
MKFVLLIIFFLLGQVTAVSQAVDKTSQIEQIKIAVGSLVTSRSRAEFLLNDPARIKGSVTALSEDSFSLKIKNANGRKARVKILYKDVLEIKGKNLSVSFIPDPQTRAFGSWDDVLKIDYNHTLEVVLENGQIISGRLGEKTKDKLTLLRETTDQKVSVPREQIIYVYRLRYEFNKAKGGTANGANKGRKIGDAIGNTSDGKAFSAALGTVVGAGIGALLGSAKKEGELRLLVYSK